VEIANPDLSRRLQMWHHIGLSELASTDDIDLWVPPTIGACGMKTRDQWRNVVSHVCDDLTTWEGRFVLASMVPTLCQWRMYLRSCVSGQPPIRAGVPKFCFNNIQTENLFPS
jgi:hypothetical protein